MILLVLCVFICKLFLNRVFIDFLSAVCSRHRTNIDVQKVYEMVLKAWNANLHLKRLFFFRSECRTSDNRSQIYLYRKFDFFSLPFFSSKSDKSEVFLLKAFWGAFECVCLAAAAPLERNNKLESESRLRGNWSFYQILHVLQKCAQVSLKSLMYIWSVSCTEEKEEWMLNGLYPNPVPL